MNEHDANQLDLYLDGLLDGEQHRQFELRVEADAELRTAVQTQSRIDTALRRLFVAPTAREPRNPESVSVTRTGARRGLWVAAALLLIGCGIILGLRSWPRPTSVVRAPESQRSTFREIHQRLVDRGYTPDWECPPGPKFAMYVYWRLGQTLLVTNTPPGVELVGWAYAASLSPETMVLLTRVDGKPVTVFIDRAEVDSPQYLAAIDGRSVFRREIHNLVTYELSDGPGPVILPLLFEPSIEPGWKDIPMYDDSPSPP